MDHSAPIAVKHDDYTTHVEMMQQMRMIWGNMSEGGGGRTDNEEGRGVAVCNMNLLPTYLLHNNKSVKSKVECTICKFKCGSMFFKVSALKCLFVCSTVT